MMEKVVAPNTAIEIGLDTGLDELRERRARLESLLEDAIDEEERVSLAIAENISKSVLATATQATGRVGAIQGALATIEQRITERESELEVLRELEARQALFEDLIELAAVGRRAMLGYEAGCAKLQKDFEAKVSELAELYADWVSARQEFCDTARVFAPAIKNYYDAPSSEERAAVEQLVHKLETERGVDLSAILAPVTHWRTVVDRPHQAPDLGDFGSLILDAVGFAGQRGAEREPKQ